MCDNVKHLHVVSEECERCVHAAVTQLCTDARMPPSRITSAPPTNINRKPWKSSAHAHWKRRIPRDQCFHLPSQDLTLYPDRRYLALIIITTLAANRKNNRDREQHCPNYTIDGPGQTLSLVGSGRVWSCRFYKFHCTDQTRPDPTRPDKVRGLVGNPLRPNALCRRPWSSPPIVEFGHISVQL